MLDKAVGKRIRRLREEQEMSREVLANRADITTKFLYEVENGKKGLSAISLLKIATALSCSCDYILLGIHSADEKCAVERMYSELLKGFDDKQRKIMLKILEVLIEISEAAPKQEL